jgi:hypothetical protein
MPIEALSLYLDVIKMLKSLFCCLAIVRCTSVQIATMTVEHPQPHCRLASYWQKYQWAAP